MADEDVHIIKEKYDIEDVNFIKPGVGETTRVLLRRIPYKILVKNKNDKNLDHIFVLANEKNVEIEVVLFTLPKDEKRAKIRLKEFTKVMNYLGCKINKICQYPDGETKMVKDRIKSTLQEIIINENPDIIFTPYILDYHLDHRVISMILAEIVKQSMTLIAMYEVWVPILHPNCYVDITEVWEKKKNALLQYQSQEKEYSIIGKSKVLNSLRAQLSFRKNVKYVESFRCMNGKQFARNAILLDAKILKGGE